MPGIPTAGMIDREKKRIIKKNLKNHTVRVDDALGESCKQIY